MPGPTHVLVGQCTRGTRENSRRVRVSCQAFIDLSVEFSIGHMDICYSSRMFIVYQVNRNMRF